MNAHTPQIGAATEVSVSALAYNVQTEPDDTAHISVAAELVNCAAGDLPKMLQAVKYNVGAYPAQTLADAGYRSEAVFEALAD